MLDTAIANALSDSRISLRLSLRDTRVVSDFPFVLEIFPQRLIPKNGKSIKDIVKTIVADFHVFQEGRSTTFIKHWGENWLHFYNHPDCDVLNGALFQHEGEDSNAMIVECDDDRIHFPDGTAYTRASFTPYTLYTARHTKRYEDIYTAILESTCDPSDTNTQMRSLALGALSTFINTPYAHRHFGSTHPDGYPHPEYIVGAVLARANRTFLNKDSGQIALSKGLDFGKTMIRELEQCWFLRPNSGYAPQTWISSDTLKALFAWADPGLFATGKAMTEAALTYNLSDLKAVHDTGKSAHEAIMTYQGRSEVDNALYANCNPDYLKPRAKLAAQKAQGLK